MRSVKDFKHKKLWCCFVLLTVVLDIAAIALYVSRGRTQFDPNLSVQTIAALAAAAVAGILLLIRPYRPLAFVFYLANLYGVIAYITSNLNLLGNLFYNIDGSTAPLPFVLITSFTVLSVVLSFAAAMLMRNRERIRKQKGTGMRRWSTLSVVFSTFLVIVVVATTVTTNYAAIINQTLGLSPYKTVEQENEGEDTEYFKAKYTTKEEIIEFFDQVCRQLESEGMVLLKNDSDALPLSTQEGSPRVSLFGTGSVNMNSSVQGIRSSSYDAGRTTLKEALEEVGVEVNETLWNFYTEGEGKDYGGTKKLVEETNLQTYFINEVPWEKYSGVQSSFEEYGDAAIVVLTRDSTEGSDVNAYGSDGQNGDYLALSPEESQLLKELTTLKMNGVFDRLIVLLNSSQPIQMDFLDDAAIDVDSCLWIGNTGMSGVNAVAEALVGTVVPSGRLSDTYVKDNFSSPAMASWGMNENKVFSNQWQEAGLDETQKYYGVYQEGIYVGYRYYETRYADVVENRSNVGVYDYDSVVYAPFGYGLSYTEFSYSDFSVSENGDGKTYDVSVTVKNTGDTYSGKEVVQIYLQKPYTEYCQEYGIEVSAVELAGFGKTEILAPGEEQTLNISVEKENFTVYDTYGEGTYILEGGEYFLTAGKDSHDAVNNILAAKGMTQEDGMDGEGNADLVWSATLERDVETYSVSAETGAEIHNALDTIDPNRYTGGDTTVSYISRSDWEGTWPTQSIVLNLTDTMEEDLQSNKPVESEGELPQYGVSSGMTLIQMRGKDYDDPDWDKLLDQITFDELNELLTTCVCNTPSVASVAKPQTKEMDGPTYGKENYEMTDGCCLPCQGIWASSFNLDLLYQAGEALANDALFKGYQGLYGPGVNLHRTPYGGRYHEYFSEDSYLTGICAQEEIQGMQQYGVIAVTKHYLLNDQEANRNGIGIWADEQTIRELYLKPWKYVVSPERGNAHAVMTSFNRVGCLWSSAHKNLVTDILRGELGFDGYVITDMASANGASYMTLLDGITAGTDCWLASAGFSFEPYKNNATIANQMREAAHRILYTVCNYSAAMNGISSSTEIVRTYTWVEILMPSLIAGFALLTAASLLMLGRSRRKMRGMEMQEGGE